MLILLSLLACGGSPAPTPEPVKEAPKEAPKEVPPPEPPKVIPAAPAKADAMESFFGRFQVTQGKVIRKVSALSDADAAKLVGKTLTLSAPEATLDGKPCKPGFSTEAIAFDTPEDAPGLRPLIEACLGSTMPPGGTALMMSGCAELPDMPIAYRRLSDTRFLAERDGAAWCLEKQP